MRQKIVLLVGVAVALMIIIHESKAQHKNIFIYGKVTTISGDSYQGSIRWGNDEVYWAELFNADKTSNDFLKFLSQREIKALSENEQGNSWLGIDLGVLSIWEDRFSRTNHRFDTRFGDIKAVEPTSKGRARLTLKNGVILEVGGDGYEDVGCTVSIYDEELGEVKVKWSRIDKVEFMPAPSQPEYRFGDPIYARIDAGRKGTFQGVIQWDKDERFQHEVLDGEDRNGDKEIPFRSIARIAKYRNGVDVTLHSGRTFYLSGSNDVNHENRGIVINDPETGQITVPWRDFVALEVLTDETLGLSYHDFPVSQGITATVITIDGDEYKGLIAYDLDEAWEFEILDGSDDHVDFKIPFRNIKNIIPKNYNYSIVNLRNGTNLLLGNERDVSEDNDGILIFTSNNDDPVYVRWSKVDEIIFD